MSVQVRRRRETATFLSTYVGAQGELIVDTTNNRVQVHDGATPGGWPAARFKVPTQTVLTTASGTSGVGTYTPPSGCSWLRAYMVGGGGGGAGSGSSAGAGGAGGVSSFGALTVNGGPGAATTGAGAVAGGVPTTGDINFNGNRGGDGMTGVVGMTFPGGLGGASTLGGGGQAASGGGGRSGIANIGSGGGGGGGTGAMTSAGGGASGSYLEKIIAAPAASYPYVVGAGGAGGAAGNGGFAGGAGGAGLIIVEEHYD